MGSKDTFTESLKASNCFFKTLIDLAPPGVFFDAEAKQKISAHQTAVAQKDASKKSNHSERLKQNKAKYDPSHPTKISELQQLLPTLNGNTGEESESDEGDQSEEGEEHDEKSAPKATPGSKNSTSLKSKKLSATPTKGNNIHPHADSSGSTKKTKGKKQKHLADDKLSNSEVSESVGTQLNSGGMTNGDIGHDDDPSEPSKKKLKPGQNNETTSSSENSTGPSPITVQPRLDTDQLREKLRTRINVLQAKRQHGMTAEEFMESKKLRRKESKLKLKQKRKEAKKLKLSVEKQAKNSHNKLNGVSEVKKDPEENANNNNKNMVFSKFQFSEQAQKKRKDKKQKQSYKDLYEKVTKDKEKLEKLKETDADKAKHIEEKNAWRKAMDQSKGVKVKDNPVLLKKSMKKEEKLKSRSKKKWEERVEHVAEQQQKRQDKRKKNIAAKKQGKVERKVQYAKKKGRMVSGF